MKFYLISLFVVVLLAVGVRAADNTTEATTQAAAVTNSSAATTASTKASTEAPSNTTTTTAATTKPTTAAPTTPAVSTNTYNVTEGDVVCIKLTAAISFDIAYTKNGNESATATIDIPADTTFGGKCNNGSTTESLLIEFFTKKWQLEFDFTEKTKTSYYVSAINLTYYIDDHFPGATPSEKAIVAALDPASNFIKGNENGYTCSAEQKLTKDKVTLITKDLKVVAFNTNDNPTYKSGALECSADDDTNSIVPIAVGAALAGLVVIVLIAYLIGRKRTRKTGYESV